jgi:hypothetical protein
MAPRDDAVTIVWQTDGVVQYPLRLVSKYARNGAQIGQFGAAGDVLEGESKEFAWEMSGHWRDVVG